MSLGLAARGAAVADSTRARRGSPRSRIRRLVSPEHRTLTEPATMEQRDWQGVFPAITTPFGGGLAVDHPRLGKHVRWLADSGCRGIVALGSLGEAATLQFEEKV